MRGKSMLRSLLILVFVAAVVVSTLALARPGPPPGPFPSPGPGPVPCPNKDIYCLDIYDPVTCDDGVTYANQCYADRACATGCEEGGPKS